MEHTQKAAAEAEAQGHGGLGLKAQRRVVEPQLFQRVPQVRVLGPVLGINAAVDHGLHGPVAREGLRRRVCPVRHRVAHPGVLDVFDGGGEIAHLPRPEAVTGLHAERQQMPALHHLVAGAGGHHLYRLPGPETALHEPHVDDDPPVAVVLAVENQGF